MPPNPFAPPSAAVVDSRSDPGVRKPLAVWLMQAVAVLVACAVAAALVGLGLGMRNYRAAVAGWQLGVFLRLAAFVGVAMLALFTVAGGQLRLAAARWCGLVLMLLVLVFDIVVAFMLAEELSVNGTQLTSAPGDVAGVLVLAGSACLALALAWASCFSARIRAWFS